MSVTVFTGALLSLLLSLSDPVHTEESFTFSHPIRNIATGRQHVVVATRNLYLFNHTLGKPKEECLQPDKTQRNCSRKEDASPGVYNIMLLVYDGTVLSCWNNPAETCTEYSIEDFTLIKGWTSSGIASSHSVSGFILKENGVCLVTATWTPRREIAMRRKDTDGVFIPEDDGSKIPINTKSSFLNFADGFHWKGSFIFPYYPSDGSNARLIVLEDSEKNCRFFNLVAQYNLTCGTETRRPVILASFTFNSSSGYLWAGVFSTNGSAAPDRTAVCIYNFSVLENKPRYKIIQDFDDNTKDTKISDPFLPIQSKPTLTHGDLSAVYILEVQKRLVLFLGTGSGQLLKVALDSNYKAGCSKVLHEFKEEAPVFHTMHLDPVDNSYIYVAAGFEIRRLRIADCEQYQSCDECLAAEDPHCGWCQSQQRCTMNSECKSTTSSNGWLEVSEDYGKCLGIHVVSATSSQITISVKKNPALFGKNAQWRCKLYKRSTREVLCNSKTIPPSLNCSCQFPARIPLGNDELAAEVTSDGVSITADFNFNNCSQYSQLSCLDCISSGCLWCTTESECRSALTPCANYADEAECKTIESKAAKSSPSNVTIKEVIPTRITFVGKKNVQIVGENLQNLYRMFLVGTSSCKPQEVRINQNQPRNNTHAFISLPQGRKEVKQLCVYFDGKCHQGHNIFYEPLPECSGNVPTIVWLSGGRNISISGKKLEFVNNMDLSENTNHKDLQFTITNNTYIYFIAPALHETSENIRINIYNEEQVIHCGTLKYKKNPVFTTYSIFHYTDDEIELRIQKTRDELNIQADEMAIIIHYANRNIPCAVQNITSHSDGNTIYCKGRTLAGKPDVSNMEVKVTLGNFVQKIEKDAQKPFLYYIFLVLPLLAIVVIAACVITRYKSKKLSKELGQQLEKMECEIRQEIRDGFAEFQTDKEVVTVETLGTIPFFDYKHFALKTFFPETDGNKHDFSEYLCEIVPSPFQKSVRNPTDGDADDVVANLKNLFNNQGFLVLLIHTLEKQKDFSIKDRCLFASYVTIIFQTDLLYFTGLLETLIKDLMEQNSSKNPKLMLRRTETVVEKLLTNWMATCLYGFVRESVGEPLYNLVNTLNQRIHKGPIDAITSKALYTLNEDWLLWQMTKFNNVEINVDFPTSENESVPDASKNLKVTVLDCDTIGQVKEKILQTFLLKNGYNLDLPFSDMCLELHYGQTFKELSDVDATSVVMANGLKGLNTVKHYKIENGSSIKIISRKDCDPVKDYSKDHFHLEMPAEENEDLQDMENKGKQKFKVKELYLTKLLSTKVSIHSAVEKLFRSIWTISHKPPIVIKYFFDFLDAQGEIRKVSDPDVLHIWKTNSLPLRFWVNILKNPQFVLDIKKTALLESCLSVIAQAFMDGFSLTDQQLGKSAPTNKLLYAKDIPQFKEEVRSYYKDIKEAQTLSSTELTDFLTSESKKHEHEFKEDVAIMGLYKYIEKHHEVIISTLEKEPTLESELKMLLHLNNINKDKSKCAWE